MAVGIALRCGGRYFRLAQPGWTDPLDTTHSKRTGGRWNAPGSFGVLYLNATVELARLQVHHKLAGQPYGVEDLDEAEQHDLATVHVPEGGHLDCVSDEGLRAAGLPASYPRDGDGEVIGWAVCQPIGQAAYDAGHAGVACRPAVDGAPGDDEELACFTRDAVTARLVERVPFSGWYWTSTS